MSNKVKKILVIIIIGLISFNLFSYIKAEDTFRWYDYIDQMLKKDYVEGEVLVGIDSTKKTFSLNRLFGGKELVDEADKITEVDGSSVEVTNNNNDISIEIIKRDDLTTREILNSLKNDPSVIFAEPNYITTVSNDNNLNVSNLPSTTSDLTSSQWYFDPNEEYSMKIPNWNMPSGNMNHEVLVAILDSGIDNEHEDLKNKIYSFSEELQNKLDCDEKRCNFVDDETLSDHGTHVAGIIGAEWNNIGISGAASNVKFVDMRIADSNGAIDIESSLRAYNTVKKAMENGVDIKIINNSWGGVVDSLVLGSVMNEAASLGAVSVIAAGNEGLNLDYSPFIPVFPSFNNGSTIAVAASDINGKRASFSNYSSNIVDLYAPGKDILSTVVTNTGLSYNDSQSDYLIDYENENNSLLYKGDTNYVTELTSEKKSQGEKSLKVHLTDETSEEYNGEYLYYMTTEYGDINTDTHPLSGSKIFSFELYSEEYKSIFNQSNRSYDIVVGTLDGSYSYAKLIKSFKKDDGWRKFYYLLPENTNYDHFYTNFTLITKEPSYNLYFDNINFLPFQKSSYDKKNGTSMATPAVSGALAVLLGNLDEDISASEAKSLLLSYVKPKASLTDTKTNGLLDLTDNSNDNPVIKNIKYSNSKIIIEGDNFKNTQGNINIKNLNFYGDLEDVTPSNISWSDKEITLSFDNELYGLYRVKVINNIYKYDNKVVATNKSNKVFENDLLLIDDYGDDNKIDSLNDYHTYGYMEAYKNYIYFMPQFDNNYELLYRYDINKGVWKRLSSMPIMIESLTGAMIDGKIIVVGNSDNKSKVYEYDIASDTWKEIKSDNVPVNSSLVNYKNQLRLISNNKIYNYDCKNDTLTSYLDLNYNTSSAKAYTDNNVLYIINNDYKIQRIKEDIVEELNNAYDIVPGDKENFSYTVLKDGLLMHANINDTYHSDIYVLNNNNDRFTSFNKRLSDDKVFNSAITSYNNKLYVITRSQHEKNNNIFRSTDINSIDINQEDIKYTILKGDNQTYKDNDLVIRANGDIDKFIKVLVNNKELDSSNYELQEGSTILTLKNNYLSTLSKGTYNLSFIYGDGSVSTKFIIEKDNYDTKDKQKAHYTDYKDGNIKNPNTIDNFTFYLLTLFISIIGLFIVYNYKKKI